MYRKKRRSWTKHVDFMLLDVLCMQIAFVISYIIRFGTDNPYTDGDYRTLAIAFLFIDFFVEIVSDSFKNVLKRGYFDEFIATCRHIRLRKSAVRASNRNLILQSRKAIKLVVLITPRQKKSLAGSRLFLWKRDCVSPTLGLKNRSKANHKKGNPGQRCNLHRCPGKK